MTEQEIDMKPKLLGLTIYAGDSVSVDNFW
jgi:hypothetical protein